MSRDDTNPELMPICDGDPLARQLALLQPLPSRLNRDQLLFDAGAASRDGTVRFWRRLSAGQGVAFATLLAVGLSGFTLPQHPGSDTTAQVSPNPSPTPVPALAATEPKKTPVEPEQPVTTYTDLPPGFPVARDDSSLPDVGRWLQLRSDILAGGMGMMPTPSGPPAPVDPYQLERSLQLPPGVLAAPYVAPRPKPKETDE